MTAAHAPGPWKRIGHRMIADANGNALCEVWSGGCDSLTAADATEALIAAAPGMLAKLRQLAGECAECQGRGCRDCADIQAVISKATRAAS